MKMFRTILSLIRIEIMSVAYGVDGLLSHQEEKLKNTTLFKPPLSFYRESMDKWLKNSICGVGSLF